MPEGAEWLIVLVLVALLFGGTQIPKLARSLGQAQKEFKAGLKEGAEADVVPEPAAEPVAKPVQKAVEQPTETTTPE